VPQRDALGLVARSSVAACYFLRIIRTVIGLTETCSPMRRPEKVLCDDFPSNVACCQDPRINSVITSSNVCAGMTQTPLNPGKECRWGIER
jgi:hypothetical protein